ncbi:PTS glucitol/sorbitol transporter subunit IIA [Williamsia sp. CHRR-6]|uniref:PTS glucitol/sorbitol transporter subunit IIA n=1 Tax=Williamsia sp. CHRR-6 TaxID=2835871 RepID=UPI001BDA5DA2|nr:PTS glucitol/sorbitol transporter subunit IIA [Williamsia sp. CHRR-6]MBT0566042.1 PTS glucitol/sorbitol transporter subunit IIA [Williamsia sp. CHRR-6]
MTATTPMPDIEPVTDTPTHTPADNTVRYDTAVTRVGSMVADFVEQKILIFFGEGAPEELHDISVLHQPVVNVGGIQTGDVLLLDEHEFEVLAVGAVANDNLVNLGHIDLKFNGKTSAGLPGDVCLPDVVPPLLIPGSRFRIVSAAAHSATVSQEQ